MANILTWKDVDYNPVNVGQGSLAATTALNQGLTALQGSIRGLEERRLNDADLRSYAEGLKLVDPAAYKAAAEAGNLQVTAGTTDFYEDLYKTTLENEKAGILNTGYRYDNEGKLIENSQAQTNLDQDIDTYNDEQLLKENAIKASPLLARIAQLGTTNTPEARAQAEQLLIDNAELLGAAGYDASAGIDEVLKRMGAGLEQTEAQDVFDEKLKTREAEDAAAPIMAEIVRLESLGTAEGAAEAAKLYRDNAVLLGDAGIDAALGASGATDAAKAASEATGGLSAAEQATEDRANEAVATEKFEEIEAEKGYVNEEEALAAVDQMSDLNVKTRQLLKAKIIAAKAEGVLYQDVDVLAEQARAAREAEKTPEIAPSVSSPTILPTTPEEIQAVLTEAIETGQPLTAAQNQALINQQRLLDAGANENLTLANVNAAFGSDREAVLRTLTTPSTEGIGSRGDMVRTAYESVTPKVLNPEAEETVSANQVIFDNAVRRIQDEWHLDYPAAIELAKGATRGAKWWNPLAPNQVIKPDIVDEYIESVIGSKDMAPEDRKARALSTLRAQDSRAVATANLAKLQEQYKGAMVDYFSAMKTGNQETAMEALDIVRYLYGKYENEVARVGASPINTSNL